MNRLVAISTFLVLITGMSVPNFPVFAINGHGTHYGPEFGGGMLVSYSDGLQVNGKSVDISNHIQTIATQKLYVSDISNLTLKIHRNGDAKAIQHVIIFLNLKGPSPQSYKSDTWIAYDKYSGVSIQDPHKIFKNVTAKTAYSNEFMYLKFSLTANNPMDTSDMIIRAWDIKGSVTEVDLLDAIKIAYLPFNFS